MADEPIQVQLAKKERPYIKVYRDFFRCTLLTPIEKMVYMSLKDFLNFSEDSGEVFPSVETLAKNVGVDRKTISRTLNSLEEKGAIKKERRGLTKTNLYTLYDNPDMWKAANIEQMQVAAESKIELSTEEMLEELKRRGAIRIIDKKNELASTPTKVIDTSTSSHSPEKNNITDSEETQVKYDCHIYGNMKCAYDADDIRDIFDIATLEMDHPELNDLIRVVVNALYDALNSEKPIRIGGQDKPVEVVRSRLLKLSKESILYSIESYQKVTVRIKSPKSYMLSILYDAADQHVLDVENLYSHNNQ